VDLNRTRGPLLLSRSPVDGELPIVPQKTPEPPVIAVIQLGAKSATKLSLRTFCTFPRELSSRRRTLPIVLEELSGMSERPMIMHHADHVGGELPIVPQTRLNGTRHCGRSSPRQIRSPLRSEFGTKACVASNRSTPREVRTCL